jgi:hypothetical protein
MWSQYFFESCSKIEIPASSPAELKTLMADAGFVDIEEHILKLPVGEWPLDQRLKLVGKSESVYVQEELDTVTKRIFTGVLKWSYERVKGFLNDMKKQVQDPQVHSYYFL